MNPPFVESAQPTLLMQDLSIVGMFVGPDLKLFGEPTGIEVSTLADWHKVIDWWFDKYARYAVAVKSQDAYRRDIDYEPTPAEKVEAVFKRKLEGGSVSPDEQKALEDHLFWYAVSKATENDLPVKLHTGYYAGDNRMPLARLVAQRRFGVRSVPGGSRDAVRLHAHQLPVLRRADRGGQAVHERLRGHVLVVDHQSRRVARIS